MKIVVAIDSYKGSATSSQLNTGVARAILSIEPECQVETISIADGGEGTLDALFENLGGEYVPVETVDLLKRPITATYLLVGTTAFIESARVVGLDKITPSPQTITQATTFGVGALVQDAVQRGAKEIFLTLGGSGTSDGGFGLLESLGYDFENDSSAACAQQLQGVSLIGLADVTNVYSGTLGYARVFGPQKGGRTEQLLQMDRQAQQFVDRVKNRTGIDLNQIDGTGAAGGLGGALVLLGGHIQPGFDTLASLLKIESALQEADLLITGEGKMDSQSLQGKVPISLAKMAKKYQIPTVLLCGSLDVDPALLDDYFLAAFSIQSSVVPLEEAMDVKQTLQNIYQQGRNVLRLLLHRI